MIRKQFSPLSIVSLVVTWQSFGKEYYIYCSNTPKSPYLCLYWEIFLRIFISLTVFVLMRVDKICKSSLSDRLWWVPTKSPSLNLSKEYEN